VLGNRPRTWATRAEFIASGYSGPTTVRFLQADKKGAVTHVPAFEARALFPGEDANIFWNESMPDERLLIQGEVCEPPADLGGLLTVRFDDTPGRSMRQAIPHFRQVQGAGAMYLLSTRCTPDSYADIREFLELHPGCVVEFSTYAINVGHQPFRNTIIWEVRNY
jgi:hypothetical protein